jgi:predicted DCC family thiol-disulfide oxidoreductase YuxK
MGPFQQPVKTWRNEDKLVLISSLCTFAFIAVGSFSYLFFGHELIASIYAGQSFDILNNLIEDHRAGRPWANLEHYFTLSKLFYSRFLVVCIAIQLTMVAAFKHRALVDKTYRFFTAETHPLNLAVFRIVLFHMIFNAVDISSVTWFSQIPAELRVAPVGLGWIVEYMPINPVPARVSSMLLLACSFTAMIGLFTRSSALAVVVLSFYVFGIPQFYGKINHYHHLLWFAAILAASRSGDALSCDALRASWKRADHFGVTDPPGPAYIYALPLRFVWVLMGGIYFFAGFWKFWESGLEWALSDNLKFIMNQKWTELGHWTPIFRIDQYPNLYRLGAVGTILFELSFVFLIFSRRLRLLAPLGGLAFHAMTDLFMRISFQSLVKCYVTFFDWNSIARRLGGWLYKKPMYVFYDGNCKLCRRTIASLRVFDLLGRVIYVNAVDRQMIQKERLDRLNSISILRDMHVVVGNKQWAGFEAYRALALRIPLLWPVVPLLYLSAVALSGKHLYRHVAESRTCNLPAARLEFRASESHSRSASRATVTVGVLLIVGSIVTGVGGVAESWPMAHYPTFAGIAGPETKTLEIIALSSAGESVTLTQKTLGREIPIERFWGLISVVLSAKDEATRRVRLRALWKLWIRNNPQLQATELLRLYEVTLITIPERWKENPIHRELLWEVSTVNFQEQPELSSQR